MHVTWLPQIFWFIFYVQNKDNFYLMGWTFLNVENINDEIDRCIQFYSRTEETLDHTNEKRKINEKTKQIRMERKKKTVKKKTMGWAHCVKQKKKKQEKYMVKNSVKKENKEKLLLDYLVSWTIGAIRNANSKGAMNGAWCAGSPARESR